MKQFLVLAVLLFPMIASAEDTRIASYYLNSPEKYVGQKITLNCSYVMRQSQPSKDGDDMVVFHAMTASKSNFLTSSVEITVHVPSDAADKFARKYGAEGKYDYNYNYTTRPMTGIFKKGGSEYFLEYTPST